MGPRVECFWYNSAHSMQWTDTDSIKIKRNDRIRINKNLTMPARAPLRVSRKLHFPRSAFCFRNWKKTVHCFPCDRVGGYSSTFFWQWIEIEVLTKFLAIHLNLVRRSTAMPPVEPPKIVFTIAKATMPPSPSWDMLPYTWIGGNQS